MRLRKLRWREDRIDHIARHDVTLEEVEEVVFGDRGIRITRVGPAERNPEQTVYRLYGRTEAGRYLLVVVIHEGGGAAMPVTARGMTAGEKRRHKG